MLPVILVAVGTYLIGDSVLSDSKKYAKGGQTKEKLAENLVTLTDEDGFEDDVVVMAKSEDDALYQAEKIKGYESSENGVVMLTDFDGNKIEYAHGGKTQGYDDKEDERLAMEHGKMSKKDLDSTHARRDDARFEERGKMAKGGVVGEYKVVPNKRGEGKLRMYVTSDYEMAFTISGSKEEAEKAAQKFVKEHNETHPTATVTKIHPSGQPIKNKNVSYVTKDEISKFEDGGMMAKGGKLVGKQKNLDVNKNGKLDAEDFKMLRKGKK
jgi:hypothetical protein